MRVHGLDGVRVVDAAAMPYITNGNIYAPVMMLAEKAADLILGVDAAAARAGRLLPPSEGLTAPEGFRAGMRARNPRMQSVY